MVILFVLLSMYLNFPWIQFWISLRLAFLGQPLKFVIYPLKQLIDTSLTSILLSNPCGCRKEKSSSFEVVSSFCVNENHFNYSANLFTLISYVQTFRLYCVLETNSEKNNTMQLTLNFYLDLFCISQQFCIQSRFLFTIIKYNKE